jgi:ATP-dependent DNA ligase
MSQAAVHRTLARLDASLVPGASPALFPGFFEPCHPTLRDGAPSGLRWIHEIKFDGYRTQAHLHSGRPAIYTRGRRNSVAGSAARARRAAMAASALPSSARRIGAARQLP